MHINPFRPVYYLGCKASFISNITAAINEVDPSKGHVCDLFAGTGVVGASFATERDVTSVDIQEYSRVLSSALLMPHHFGADQINSIISDLKNSSLFSNLEYCLKPLIEYENECIQKAILGDVQNLVQLVESQPLIGYESNQIDRNYSKFDEAKHKSIHRLKEFGLVKSKNSTVTMYFAGVYFSYLQSVLLDVILAASDSYPTQMRDTLIAAALSTASSLVNTIGKQFAQPIRPRDKSGAIKSNFASLVQRDRSLDVFEIYSGFLIKYSELPRSNKKIETLRQDYLEALNQHASRFSVVYADPPYTRDHYSRFYHVLETMCLRDNPTVSKVRKGGLLELSRGGYREERHQSPFCIRSTAPSAFDSLFKMVSQYKLPLVLSYSPHETGDGTHPRVVSMNQIVELARSYYPRVELSTVAGAVHNQLNRSALKLKEREHAEVLVKCFI